MSDFEDGIYREIPKNGGTLTFKAVQDAFEKSLFTTAHQELRGVVRQEYSKLNHPAFSPETIDTALEALSARSISWMCFPQDAAMDDQRHTLKTLVSEVRDILAPISYAAEEFAKKNHAGYAEFDDAAIAAIYFESLKQRLEHKLKQAQEILEKGSLVIEPKNNKSEGPFGKLVDTTTSKHMMGLQAIMTYNTEFLEDTKQTAHAVGLSKENTDKLIHRFSGIMLAVDNYAKATSGDENKNLVRQQAMFKRITRLTPGILHLVAEMQDKASNHPECANQMRLIGLVVENLQDINQLRGR